MLHYYETSNNMDFFNSQIDSNIEDGLVESLSWNTLTNFSHFGLKDLLFTGPHSEFNIADAVQDCLDSEDIYRLEWPSHSLDVNPMENIIDCLGRSIEAKQYLSVNKDTLIRTLKEKWYNLPQHSTTYDRCTKYTMTCGKLYHVVVSGGHTA